MTNWTYFPKWVRWLTNVFDVNFQKLRNLSKLRKSELPEGSDNRGMQKCSVLSLEGGKCKWCFWMIPFRSSYPEPFHPNSTEGFLWHHAAPHIAMQALMLHGISANTHTHTSHQKLIYNKENWRHTNTNGNEKILAEHESQISIKIIAVAEP